MIFKRKIYESLLEWKNKSNGASACLIEGARRIGKSTVAIEFAKNEYDNYILIDFSKEDKETKDYTEAFNTMTDFDDFFRKLFLISNKELKPRKGVIIFDEIQKFPRARQAIKHLVKDGRFDYIETGSLISIKKNVKDILIPSEEERIYMYPMDFEEFLIGTDNEVRLNYLKDFYNVKKPLGTGIHKIYMDLFNKYMLVGGMPQAVKAYKEGKSFQEIDRIKRNIIELYIEDIKKNDEEDTTTKSSTLFKLLPSQLMNNNRAYKFSEIDKNARYINYANNVEFLDESMICNKVTAVSNLDAFIDLYREDNRFKMFMGDTGLLITYITMTSKDIGEKIYRDLLLGRSMSNLGMVYENVVAQMLKARGYKLYYHDYKLLNKESNKEKKYELDFVIVKNGRIVPIEVKSSSKYLKHKSLDNVKNKYGIRCTEKYVITCNDYKQDENATYLPIYMTCYL